MPDDGPLEPKIITLIGHDSDGKWELEIDFPDWVSPWEAWGMLAHAAEIQYGNLEAEEDE